MTNVLFAYGEPGKANFIWTKIRYSEKKSFKPPNKFPTVNHTNDTERANKSMYIKNKIITRAVISSLKDENERRA